MKVDPQLGILGVLLEPTTVVTKAWEMVKAVGQRSFWEPRNVLITGAGSIGLLAAGIGVKYGLDVHVLDRVTTGPKVELVKDIGATYHSTSVADLGFEPDVIVGSVNANKRHWYKSAQALAQAKREWLERLITRRESPENFKQALDREPDDIKVIILFADI